ncbi:POL4 protein, partial [Leiothrix lutea]|nr:POL4 protein [Leiothrix lutea]
LHELTHWGVQGLCDHFLRENLCLGVYGLATAITKGCVVRQKVNQKVMRKTEPGGRELAQRPFQSIQVGFTEMPSLQGYKHLLVIVDHLTHWVEVFPTKKETAQSVLKIILENIIPQYGIVNYIDSDRGSHFTARVLQQVMEALGIRWELHTPWHSQSSGRVERMNKTLKNVLSNLIQETRMNWLRSLSLALLRIRTRPWADIGASPYEMLFGKTTEKPLRKRGYLPQTSPLDVKVHDINPGDWVLIKSWD